MLGMKTKADHPRSQINSISVFSMVTWAAPAWTRACDILISCYHFALLIVINASHKSQPLQFSILYMAQCKTRVLKHTKLHLKMPL